MYHIPKNFGGGGNKQSLIHHLTFNMLKGHSYKIKAKNGSQKDIKVLE